MRHLIGRTPALAGALTACAFAATAALKAPTLKYEQYKLANGLEVILHEDHRLPLVAVDIWYHVGPLNEEPGRTGFAHLFEHMMFEGSEHVGEKAHFRFLESAGATGINGTTSFDRTNYFETVPSNQVELALWLESDRMGFLLEELDRARLTNQRDVVRNERRQGENAPYGLTEEAMYHLLFPKAHPYYADVIGSHADIEAARLQDVRHFFQQYYAPNNATMAIAGDFDPAKVKALAEKYSGPIPTGPPAKKVSVETPPITAEKRATVTDAVKLSQFTVAWLAPPAFHAGDADSTLLARILGGGKASRLYRRLVYSDQIAQNVDCSDESLALASVASCTITARPGVKPEALETAFDAELERLRADGPTQAELDRARNIVLTRKIQRLQRLGGFGGVADMMNLYNQYVGDPGYLAKDVQMYQDATVASVQAAAKQWFGENQRVVVYTVPGKKVLDDVPRSPADTDASVKVENPYSEKFEAEQAWRKQPPSAGISPALHLPAPRVFALGNGLKVYFVENHALPLMNAALLDLAGSDVNPAAMPGTAGFTARMLTEGTARRSSAQLADDADRIGASLGAQAQADNAIASVGALSANADAGLDLLSDIVEHPSFRAEEVERIRKERLANIVEEADDPFQSFFRVAEKARSEEHTSELQSSGTTAAVRSLTRDQIADFWAEHYAPQNAALVLAGDLTERDARRLADKYFGAWTATSAFTPSPVPKTPDAPALHIIIVDKPGAPQTALGAVGIGEPRSSPDYVPLNVLNEVLGGMFSSRINMNLRENKGYTYGMFSRYDFRRGAGPFVAAGLVRTDVTGPAASELFKELKRMRTEPPTGDEMSRARDYSLRSLPGQFETLEQTSRLIGNLFVYNLANDYYRRLPALFDSVTSDAVKRVAEEDLHPEHLVLVAVGDRAKIQAPLEKLNLGPVEVRNESGDLVSDK